MLGSSLPTSFRYVGYRKICPKIDVLIRLVKGNKMGVEHAYEDIGIPPSVGSLATNVQSRDKPVATKMQPVACFLG